MTDTMTPRPVPPAPAPGAPAPDRAPRASSRVIAILAIALGALIVVGTVLSSVLSTVAAASTTTDSRTVAVEGVDGLVADLAAGTLRVEFADVTEAELEVTSAFGSGDWTLERSDDDLVVKSPEWRFGWLWPFRDNVRAVLRLPQALDGMDASMRMGAGELIASGDFGELDLDVDAGRARVDGTATELTADLSAGGADIDLANVRSAELTVNAGSMNASLTGSQPDDVTVEVNAGSVNLGLPDGEYDVRSNVSAGDVDDRIGSTPGAGSTVVIDVSAGSVTLRESRP